MIFRQIYEDGLAQASYLFGCPASGEAMVVDPRRDIDVYLAEAERWGLRIVAVGETHIHADFLSGARALAKLTGAALYLSDEGDDEWRYRGLEGFSVRWLKDGDTWAIGNLRVQALHTPGHTPEHISFVIYASSQAEAPIAVITGDFAFVGDLGRPDLLEQAVGQLGTAEQGAYLQYRSLCEKLLNLPDFVQIWPGHGAGSACGKALGALPATTVGYERRFAWWAKYTQGQEAKAFVSELLQDQPEPPTYFARMKQLNRDGMPLLFEVPRPTRLSEEAVRQAQTQGAVLIDTRPHQAFAKHHVRGALNIPAGRQFSTWAGWLVPYDKPIVLLSEPKSVEPLVRGLIRVGLDAILGYYPVQDAVARWGDASVQSLTPEEARQKGRSGEALLLDVRSAMEYREGHIPGARHLHAGRVVQYAHLVPRERPVIVYCATGARSCIAVSALQALGFDNLLHLEGGMEAWQASGYEVVRSEAGTIEPLGGTR